MALVDIISKITRFLIKPYISNENLIVHLTMSLSRVN